MSKIKQLAVLVIAFIMILALPSSVMAANRCEEMLTKYENDDTVEQLIFVKYKKSAKATLTLYQKTDTDESWVKVLETPAYVGKKGINKKKEGDKKTPTGVFTIQSAFGRKANPGTVLPYTKLNKYLYWCGDKKYYNQMIDIRKKKHSCKGEHLIKYAPHYDYAIDIGYNTDNKYKKGSAIFLHCKGKKNYTSGCIAVSKKSMISILKTCNEKTKICIYK